MDYRLWLKMCLHILNENLLKLSFVTVKYTVHWKNRATSIIQKLPNKQIKSCAVPYNVAAILLHNIKDWCGCEKHKGVLQIKHHCGHHKNNSSSLLVCISSTRFFFHFEWACTCDAHIHLHVMCSYPQLADIIMDKVTLISLLAWQVFFFLLLEPDFAQ